MIGWGYILAVLIPPIGFVIGVLTLTKERVGHGIAIMALAICMTPVWVLVAVPGAAS